MDLKKNLSTWKDEIKVILICLLVLLLIVTVIMTTVKKEEQNMSEDKIVSTFSDNGEFIFNTTEKQNTITFTLKNETNNKKNYNLEIKSVTNPLNDISKLTYDLWINDIQEVSNEIFPNVEMLLLEGSTIDAHETLEYKLILKYAEEEIESSKTVRGKLTIKDTKH